MTPNKEQRGFAVMKPDVVQEIARVGGAASSSRPYRDPKFARLAAMKRWHPELYEQLKKDYDAS